MVARLAFANVRRMTTTLLASSVHKWLAVPLHPASLRLTNGYIRRESTLPRTSWGLGSYGQVSNGSRSLSVMSKTSECQENVEDSDTDDEDVIGGSDSSSSTRVASAAEKPMRVERLLANLGYGNRKDCSIIIKRRRLVYADTGQPTKVGEKALAWQLLLDGKPLDDPPPLTLLLHKPVGYVVTSPADENVLDPKIYDLLPYRFGRRKPFLSAIGRLDKETSGLLLLTDDGQLLHSIQSPTKGIWKLYTAQLAAPLTSKEAAAAARLFACGTLQLAGDRTPLLPAGLHMLDVMTAEVAICEGRYHQIRRMFASLGHEVAALHRHAIGGLHLNSLDLPEGSWRRATPADLAAVMVGPDNLEQAMDHQQQQQEHQDPQKQQLQLLQTHSQHDEPPANFQQAGQANKRSSSGSSRRTRSDGVGYSTGSLNSTTISGSPLAHVDDIADASDAEQITKQLTVSKKHRNTSKTARRRAALGRAVLAFQRRQQ